MAKKLIQVVYKVDNKELKATSAEIRKLEKDTKESEKGFQQIGTTGKAAFAAISGAIAALGLVQLGRQIIQITGEFQKFQAVLTNTLGSRGAAVAAMKQIQTFAAQTPFSVQELTASFVKLANQGFKPTANELRKLGDLASAMGKSFDQLTEAIIDAQTGEFERLKEFGIRAAKEGDNVTFTFKGVQTQVDFTAASIREYILALGDLEGVSGGMAAISETLVGRISNLGDAYDSLLTKIGNANSGVIFESIELLSKMIDVLNISMSDPISDKAAENAQTFRDTLDAAFKTGDPAAINKAIQDNVTETNHWNESIKELTKEVAQASEEDFPRLNAQLQVEQATVKLLSALTQEYITKASTLTTVTKGLTAEEKKLLEQRQKFLKEFLKTGTEDPESDFFGFNQEAIDGFLDKFEFSTRDAINKADELIDSQGKDENPPIIDVLTGGKDKDDLKDELDMLLDMSFSFLDDLLLATVTTQQKVFQAEEGNFERRLLLAGDNERARQEIEVEKLAFDQEQAKKKEEFDRLQNERNKQAAIKKMTIEVILAGVRALAEPPSPNFIKAGLALAFGFGQIGLAKAVGFKDGVIDLQGPGTGTSDSIPAMLSKGESVMTADETARSYNLLTAIREKKLDDRVLAKASTSQMIVASLNDHGIIKAIKENKGPSFAREGYTLMETHQIGSNLKRKIRAKVGL